MSHPNCPFELLSERGINARERAKKKKTPSQAPPKPQRLHLFAPSQRKQPFLGRVVKSGQSLMAPRKRKAEEQNADDAPAFLVEKRVTRGSVRRAHAAGESEPMKVEVKGRKKGGKKKMEKEVVENGKEKGAVAEEKEEVAVVNVGEVVNGKTVVIEHCKQCNSFKTRAIQVKNGLEKGIPGIAVEINPEKPRRGCFEVREGGGEKFISLLDMKRPFGPMKALDMEKVIVDIIDMIKA